MPIAELSPAASELLAKMCEARATAAGMLALFTGGEALDLRCGDVYTQLSDRFAGCKEK